ncbi:unnamed protein product [Arabidopsis lyrata]|nr:unnamed protein product [Arabidopsis lyrata]
MHQNKTEEKEPVTLIFNANVSQCKICAMEADYIDHREHLHLLRFVYA